MKEKEKLAEIQLIRAILNRVEMNYCESQNEHKAIKDISMRLDIMEKELLSEAVEVKANDIKVVDLGLPSGTLWTDRNVGASSPENAGEYFRFGETSPFTKDSPEYVFFYKKEENVAGTEMDAATTILGKEYQTPTRLQLRELLTECSHQRTQVNGVNGTMFTGPNGNSIFLPAAGYRIDGDCSLFHMDLNGYYWSASPYGNDRARYMIFGAINDKNIWEIHTVKQTVGFSIRAVKKQ